MDEFKSADETLILSSASRRKRLMVSSDNSASSSSTTPPDGEEREAVEALTTSWMFLPFSAPAAVCRSSRGSSVGIAG